MNTFNIGDTVVFGARLRNIYGKQRRRGARFPIPKHTGTVIAIDDKSIQISSPQYSNDLIVFTLRKNGNFVEKGEPDDKYDRVSLRYPIKTEEL